MKKLVYILLVISILIFFISLAGFFYGNRTLETYNIYTNVNVTNGRIGFDVNGTALTFGVVGEGISSSRNIIFTNNYDFPVIVKINANGGIKSLLRFDDVVRVELGETKKIPFILTPSSNDDGFYDGSITFTIKRDYRKDI